MRVHADSAHGRSIWKSIKRVFWFVQELNDTNRAEFNHRRLTIGPNACLLQNIKNLLDT